MMIIKILQSRTSWRDRVDAGQLYAKDILTLGTSWCQKCHTKTKIPFAAALAKHINNPIWCNFYLLTMVVVNKLLFFNCGSIIYLS